MKQLVLFLLSVLIFYAGFSQADYPKYSKVAGYGFVYKRHAIDSVALMPLATSPHAPYRAGGYRYNETDSTMELWTGYQWLKINPGAVTIDTTALYRQNGNSFGATAIIGTNDNNAFSFETNTLTRMTISNTGLIGINTAPLAGYQLRTRGLPTRLSSLQIDSQSVFSGNPAGISLYARPAVLAPGTYTAGVLEYSFPTVNTPGWFAYLGVQSWAYLFGATPQQPGNAGAGAKFRNYMTAFSGGQVYDNDNTTLHFQMGHFSSLNNQHGTVQYGVDYYVSDYNSVNATTNNDTVQNHVGLLIEPFNYSVGPTRNMGILQRGTQSNAFMGNLSVGDSVAAAKLHVAGNVKINNIPNGTVADSILVVNGGEIRKRLINLDGDVFVPTVLGVINVDGVTVGDFDYIRVGNIVHWSGSVEIDATTTGINTSISITLPFPTTMTNLTNLKGGGHFGIDGSGLVVANSNIALYGFNAQGVGGEVHQIWGQYRIVP